MKTKNIFIFFIAALFLVSMPFTLTALERSEIPDKYKWHPDHIYPSLEEWEKDFEYLGEQIDVLAAFKGRFAGENATDPAGALIEFQEIGEILEQKLERLWVYVMFNYHVDMGNSDWAGMQQRIQMLAIGFSQKLAWAEPELLEIPQETMNRYVAENPELVDYQKSFDDMYLQQEHVLSEAEESVIAASYNITGTSRDVFGKLTDVDMSFGEIKDEDSETIEVTDSGWNSWRVDKNRRIREDYFKKLWNGYEGFGNTLAALMNGNIKKNVYFSTVRKYDNTLQAALDGSFIPEDVYVNLIETTRANLAPLHKYNEIRKRLLGVDHYRHWDYYVSLVEADETRYTWEEGVDMIVNALKPLGKQYRKDIKMALNPENGWCDAFANENKRGGAYSSSCYGVHPYMLYNFDYTKGLTLEDVSTIAHEVGHAMHTYYSENTQPFPNKSYATFNAEVASTVNEAIMATKLLADARKAYKKAKKANKEAAKQRLIYLLETNINAVRTTFYRQTMFATWEWEANKMGEAGQPLTKDSMSKLYYDTLTEFHGPAAEYEELSSISWARIPHFYRGYYVYTYATSYAAAVALATDINGKKKGAVKKYIAYLQSGSSKHPVELLQDAGVDMATPAPVEALVAYFSNMVEELDELTR
ncbi:oligoendopeptidase F [candidate division LCP-89 bacterium B3_LCP]|uniref:Oligopeptidase F n=1 Tax=candidate division LCP-89 bacterium B3_LCP TaxID=2012998 RepID=A0A532UZ21_UNCL8|nr:MAG: oligoendopeptidase F [candidate division LCP-89 bacterium B3_LCP]